MGQVAELFDAMTIRVKSPDARILGMLHKRNRIAISFADDEAYYEYSDVSSLEKALEAVLKALFNARKEAHQAILSKLDGWGGKTGAHWDANRRRFHEESLRISAYGISSRSFVELDAVAMREWEVEIDPAALDDLDPDEFCTEFHSALTGLQRDHSAETQKLKQDLYSTIGVSNQERQRARAGREAGRRPDRERKRGLL